MRAMWIGTETARQLGLGNEFFDLKDGYVTPPGKAFLRNAESAYGLWFVPLQYYPGAMEGEARLQSAGLGEPDDRGLRSFQGRAAHGALTISREWTVVIMCTILEAYMKDILELAATENKSFMGRYPVEIALKTDEIIDANSFTELEPVITRRWAETWLRNRRAPRAWVNGFQSMGVQGFPGDVADRLEETVAMRNLIVHSAGFADQAYLRRVPNSGASLGEKIALSEDALRRSISVTFDFFAPVEAHFVQELVHSHEGE